MSNRAHHKLRLYFIHFYTDAGGSGLNDQLSLSSLSSVVPRHVVVWLWSEGTDLALSRHKPQCRHTVLWPKGVMSMHTLTHKQREQPRGILYEGISVNIQWQSRCWWPCEVESVLRAWCWLISTTNMQERSELVILVKTPPAIHSPATLLLLHTDKRPQLLQRKQADTCGS